MENMKALRRVILGRLFDHLREHYGIELTREAFVDGDLSLRRIDELLAFKSDLRIGELRGALGRLEEGTYGTCIVCKARMQAELLLDDPTRRCCSGCEKRLSRAAIHSGHASLHL